MDTLRQGLLMPQPVTAADEAEMRKLLEICNNYENLHIRFSQRDVRTHPDNALPDFLYYEQGQLVGCLVLDSFGSKEKEVPGMVHPNYRRKGIFSALLAAAKKECAAHGVQHLVFVVEHDSPSGQAFVASVGAQYDFSEYEMVLATFHDRMAFDERLNYRKANDSDLDLLVSIMMDSFGDPEESVRPRVAWLLRDPHCRLYVATFGEASLGCKEPVGCLRLEESNDAISIYGFGVRPDYRGRGYGRQMLEETIRAVRPHSQKQITLEVDTNNNNAFGLYRSVGFTVRTTYDYYNLDIA